MSGWAVLGLVAYAFLCGGLCGYAKGYEDSYRKAKAEVMKFFLDFLEKLRVSGMLLIHKDFHQLLCEHEKEVGHERAH